MSWKGPPKQIITCAAICTLTLVLLILSQYNNTRTLRTKHRLLTRHKWNLVPGFNDTFTTKSTVLPDIPSWVPKLSRTLKESSQIPIYRLQAMFTDAKFFSWPAVGFNSTVIQNILGDLDMDNFDPQLKVPNIVHLTWFYYPKRQAFRFHQVICLLSIRKFIKPDKILFWYDIEPVGKWWHYIKGIMSNILMVHRKAPTKIFKNRIRIPEHKSDVARLEAIIAFGGKSSAVIVAAWV